jgi:hypothetical protein
MDEIQNKLAGILDIQPPLPPADSSSMPLILTLSAVILLLLAIAGIWRYRHSLRAQARRRLALLKHEYQAQQYDDKYTAFQLATILRTGLRQQQLSTDTLLPAGIDQYRQRWNDFIGKLDAARYSANGCNESTLEAIFTEAEFWLRRWP